MSKKNQQQDAVPLDLHGLTLTEACQKIERTVAQLLQRSSPIKLRIITGKGRHSGPDGSVLPKEIHGFVSRKYQGKIVKIESSPHEVSIDGMPIRGHFDVILKK